MAATVGPLQAIIDAIHNEDERIGGRALTRLTAPLTKTEVGTIAVESTLRFGEFKDGTGNGRVLINGELIDFVTKTQTSFDTLTRGVKVSDILLHPEGSIVWDLAQNSSALDHVRRGFLVDFARNEDLDIIARNLGLAKCTGITEDTWREVIKALAYLPKQTPNAFNVALTALFGAGNFTVLENSPDDVDARWTVRVKVKSDINDEIRGKFYLNGGEEALTTGLTTVVVAEPIVGVSPDGVLNVYTANDATRLGIFTGATELYGAGSHAGSTITLSTSPGPIGTAVICNYTAHTAHYTAGVPLTDAPASTRIPALGFENGRLPPDASGIRHDGDFYAYLSDPLFAVQCVLDQVRAAGIRLELTSLPP